MRSHTLKSFVRSGVQIKSLLLGISMPDSQAVFLRAPPPPAHVDLESRAARKAPGTIFKTQGSNKCASCNKKPADTAFWKAFCQVILRKPSSLDIKTHSHCGCSPLGLVLSKGPSLNTGFRPLHIRLCKHSCQEERCTRSALEI